MAQKMRPMQKDDLLISRVKLLIIMAKAKLKGYPMGDFRKNAVAENARFVFHEALVRSAPNPPESPSGPARQKPAIDFRYHDHLFLQRAQLLAVMINSFIQGKSQGGYRKKAMVENVKQICGYFAERFQLGNIQFLKVA
jgi:hypothetical protein